MESKITTTLLPKNLKLAANLIYFSLILGLLKFILYPIVSTQQVPTGPLALATAIITLLIISFFAFKIGQGKNWARITFLVLFIIGMIGYGFLPLREFQTNLLIGFISVIQTLLQLYVLIILFTGECKEWFKNKK